MSSLKNIYEIVTVIVSLSELFDFASKQTHELRMEPPFKHLSGILAATGDPSLPLLHRYREVLHPWHYHQHAGRRKLGGGKALAGLVSQGQRGRSPCWLAHARHYQGRGLWVGDGPLLTGSALICHGPIEMEASIMDGCGWRCSTVSWCLHRQSVKNTVSLAVASWTCPPRPTYFDGTKDMFACE